MDSSPGFASALTADVGGLTALTPCPGTSQVGLSECMSHRCSGLDGQTGCPCLPASSQPSARPHHTGGHWGVTSFSKPPRLQIVRKYNHLVFSFFLLHNHVLGQARHTHTHSHTHTRVHSHTRTNSMQLEKLHLPECLRTCLVVGGRDVPQTEEVRRDS